MFLDEFQLNHLYVGLLFLGVALSVLSVDPKEKRRTVSEGDAAETSEDRQLLYEIGHICSNLLMWGALIIPITNYVRYKMADLYISRDPPREASERTFNGRPSTGNKRGSQIDFPDLRNFYVNEPAPEQMPSNRSSSHHSSHLPANGWSQEGQSLTDRLDEEFSGTSWSFAHGGNTKKSSSNEHPNIVRTGLARDTAQRMTSPLNASRVAATEVRHNTRRKFSRNDSASTQDPAATL